MPAVTKVLQLQVFDTDLGVLLLVWQEDLLVRLRYGGEVTESLEQELGSGQEVVTSVSLLMRQAQEQLTRFASGEAVSLGDVSLDMRGRTSFQVRTLAACRKIPWGSVVSYGELARRIGKPRAARAVGSVMKSNRHPLVVPCHRVISANGGLGGYSADDGLCTKARLLSQEGIGKYADAMGLG